MDQHPDSPALDAASPGLSFAAESLTPTPAVDGANALAPRPDARPPVAPDDAPAQNLDAYDWYPVLRKARPDGWTPQAQRGFIEELADTGSVMQAAMAVGKTRSSAYKLRRSPGAESFAAAWAAAIDAASARALDECFERALVGSDEPVFDRDGRRVGRRFRQSDRLLMFIVRAYMPDRFRHASRDVRLPAEPPPPPLEPVARALALLDPPRPERPEETWHPDDLEIRLQCADILEGQLPRWHRAEPERLDPMPLGEDFERKLENAKLEGAGKPPLTDEEWATHRAMLLGRAGPPPDREVMPGAY